MLRNIGIRSKILAVLALPVLVLLLAAGIIAAGAVSDARRAAQVEILAGQAGDLTQLVRGLQAERALSIAVLSGDAAARPALDEVRGAIDSGLEQVRGAIGGVNLDLIDASAAEAVARSQAAHEQIAPLRAQVDQQALSPAAAHTAYTAIIADDVALPGRIGDAVEDRDLATHLRAYTALEELAESITAERDLGTASVAAGVLTPAARTEMTTLVTRQDVLREQATLVAAQVGARVPALGYELQLARGKTVLDADGVIDTIGADEWRATVDREVGALGSTFQRLAEGASERAAALSENARSQAMLIGALAGAAVVVPLLLALLLARRITLPLRRLTEAAGQVREDLPLMVERMQTPGEGPGIEIPQIPVQSGDEVGRLAAAFNAVNATTVQVAQEQAALRGSIAAMFVNVARRDQVLLSRQLAFIDQLERTEENPATLDNLFRLDHLATRMRRNAESLLVLAGIDTGRRLRRPMPLSDVIRTASSEIEHYERIDLALRVDPPVVGHVALTTAHLLAELLENATNFSDPDSRVVVSTGTGPGGIVVTIVDDGLGMTPEEIAEANTRIADPPVSEVVGSQRLGFFVVGRLARKLDATVTLRSGRSRGTVVTIELVPAIFVPGSVVELPSPAEDLEDAEVAADAEAGDVPAEDARADGDAATARAGEPQASSVPAPEVPTVRTTDTAPSLGGLPRRGSVPALRPADSLLNGVVRPDSGAPTVPSTAPGTGPSDLPLPRRSRSVPVPVPAAAPETDAPAEVQAAPDAGALTAEPDVEQAEEPSVEAAPPVRSGGLFSGFRARQHRPADDEPDEAAPESSAVEVAADEETPEPVISLPEPVAVAPEPVAVEPEPVATEPEPAPAQPATVFAPLEAPAVDEGAHRAAASELSALVRRPAPAPPVPAAEDQPEPEPAPPAVGAAALDILPGRAAARAGRRPRRGLFERRTRQPAPAEPPAVPSSAPVEQGGGPVPEPAARQAPESAPGTPFVATPPVPAQTRTEDAALTQRSTPRHPAAEGPDVDAAPPSLFGTPAAPPVFAMPTEPQSGSALPTRGGNASASPAGVPATVAAAAADGVSDTSATAPAPVPQPIGDVLRQRSALASEALTELSRLSTYRPSVEQQAPAALTRRTPAATPAAAPSPVNRPPVGGARRSRSASDVRSMLSGFQAGVERGRTAPGAPQSLDHSAASEEQP